MSDEPLENTAESSGVRNHSIRWAVITSLLSKVGTIVLRLISIPIAVKTLGYEEFGVYVAITIVVTMIDILHVGIGPALTKYIRRAVTRGDQEEERYAFVTGFLISTGLTLTISTGLALLVWNVPITTIFGAKFAPYADSMRNAVWIAIIIVSIQLICVVCEKARDGYMETRYNNTWGAIANFMAAIGLIVGLRFFPTIEFLVIVISGSLAFAKLANTIHLLIQRPYLFPWLSKFRKALVKPLMADSVRFTVTYGFNGILEYNILAFLCGYVLGPEATATWNIMVTIHFSATGLMQMFTVPMWPALMDAHARRDYPWISKAAKRITLLGLAFAVCFGIGLVALGPWALPLWVKGFSMDRLTLTIFSIYFLLHIWRTVNQMLVLGLGKTDLCVRAIIVECLLIAIGAWWVLNTVGNITAVYVVIAISMFLVTTWIFPLTFWRTLRKESRDSPPAQPSSSSIAG